MATSVRLCAQRINNGRSEIWLEADETTTPNRRVIASNEVRNVVQRLCPESFETFYQEWYARESVIAKLDDPNLFEVAVELKLSWISS